MFDLSYCMPTKVFYGEHCVSKNASYFAELGNKCLLVTGKHSAKASGALEDVENALQKAGVAYEIFDEIAQNPLLSVCQKAAEQARKMQADFIVGVGGGSPLDAAKAIGVLAANEIEPIRLFDGDYAHTPLPCVLIGTTAGTGSEVTPYSVLTVDTEDNGVPRKRSVAGLFAKACFCDYRYTRSLPYETTLATALDALAHCIEGYFSKRANSLSDLFAKTGARLIADVLFDLPADGCLSDKQRDKLYAASIYGGLTIAKTGTGFCHTMGYFLTEEYGVAHGTACAVFLPSYLEIGCDAEYKKANALLAELDCSVSELSSVIQNLTHRKPLHLTQTQKNDLQKRWEGNKNFANSPGIFAVEDAMDIIEDLF